MWAALEPVGRSSSTGGYHRFAWTREDHDLREWFAAECARRGLDLAEDRMGNQWGWWGDPDSAAARGASGIVTGSHLDSVPDGGAFDGPLGVVSALAALDELRDRGFEPGRPIGVVNFVDEEGSRFGVACAGSRVITGALSPDRARSLTDAHGTTMAEALATAGRDPSTPGSRSGGPGPHRGLRRAPRRAGPRPRRPRPPGRPRHRHLAARTLAAGLPGRGQPRRHHAPRGPP